MHIYYKYADMGASKPIWTETDSTNIGKKSKGGKKFIFTFHVHGRGWKHKIINKNRLD